LIKKNRPTSRAGGQGRAFASPLGIQRLWHFLLFEFFLPIPALAANAGRWAVKTSVHMK